MLRVISEISEIFSNFQCISTEHILISESWNYCGVCVTSPQNGIGIKWPRSHTAGSSLWFFRVSFSVQCTSLVCFYYPVVFDIGWIILVKTPVRSSPTNRRLFDTVAIHVNFFGFNCRRLDCYTECLRVGSLWSIIYICPKHTNEHQLRTDRRRGRSGIPVL